MGKAQESEQTAEADSLKATFHQVQSLISTDQELLRIEPNMRVADALKLMQKHGYSQLPVVVGKAVLGVFSYRSFSAKALTRQKSIKGEWLGEMPVEDFLEDYEFVHGSQDWNHIVDYLNRDDAFFVGHLNGLDGLVTTMDVLDYFREIANPFIILAEIELSLREVIQKSIPEENWHASLEGSLTTAFEGKAVPKDLGDMTFDNYVQIISNSDNWRYFEAFFDPGDVSRKQTTRKLQQLRDWRNVIFHFRRPLDSWELDTLVEYRAWVQRRMRAFEAKRIDKTLPEPLKEPKRGKMNREKLLAASEPDAAQFFDWLLHQAQNHAQYYAVDWHPVSFSVRLRRGGQRLGFAYGYAPDKYEIYFQYLPVEGSALAELRRALLGFGVFTESGDHTLKARILSPDSFTRACEASQFLLLRLTEWSS